MCSTCCCDLSRSFLLYIGKLQQNILMQYNYDYVAVANHNLDHVSDSKTGGGAMN